MSKERLVELIGQAKSVEASGIDCEVTDEYIADHLLASEEVIVLPFKIGQTLYDISEFLDGTASPIMYELCSPSIEIDRVTEDVYLISYDGCYIYPDEIGKTILFSREEAEKKLEEGEKNA
jgi:hypothetical protein